MELIHESAGKKLYRDGDKLVKTFDESYSKAGILNEALNQARVEETGLNIPKVRAVTVVDGRWALIWDFIEGETLESLMQKHPEKEDEYLNFFVDLQIRMSKEKVPLLGHLRDKMHAKISASAYPATVRYDLHMRLDGLPRHVKLCHGDFQPSNVIITKDGTPYIIDWSHATQGNGSADAARTYLIFKLQGKDALAEKYLNLFCTKTDTAIQYVQRSPSRASPKSRSSLQSGSTSAIGSKRVHTFSFKLMKEKVVSSRDNPRIRLSPNRRFSTRRR